MNLKVLAVPEFRPSLLEYEATHILLELVPVTMFDRRQRIVHIRVVPLMQYLSPLSDPLVLLLQEEREAVPFVIA